MPLCSNERRSVSFVRLSGRLLASLFLAACGGGGDGGSLPPQPGTLAVSLVPAQTLRPGESVSHAINIARGGSFSGPVSLSVEGTNTGVSASLLPATVDPATTSAFLIVNVAAGTAPQIATLTVRGRGTGVSDATATIVITVPAVAGNVTVAVSPSTATIAVGATQTLTAIVTGSSNTGVVWSSGATTVATVSGTGVVTGVSAGTATITAASVADASRRASATITVTAPTGTPAFTLSTSPNSVSIAAGATSAVTATIARAGGFAGAVDVTVEGLPSGVTASAASVAAASTTATITLTASATATGNTTATIRARASGLTDRTASLPVTVTIGGGTAGVTRYTTVSAGYQFACGIATTGITYCWGSNGFGQLGTGTAMTTALFYPAAVAGGLSFTSISAGTGHACALTTNGTAYCWGRNDHGQLGTGSAVTSASTPQLVSGSLRFRAITAGANYTCGVTTAGAGYCWGQAGDKLGLGRAVTGAVRSPEPVAGGVSFSQIDVGFVDQSCGIATSGDAYCWGGNLYGQLGDGGSTGGSSSSWNTPRLVAGGLRYRSIVVMHTATCASTTTNELYCWGTASFGRLADGRSSTSAFSSRPTLASGGLAVRAVAGDNGTACALTTAGDVYCWGIEVGNLGDAAALGRLNTTPTRWIGTGIALVSFSASDGNACGLDAGGVAYCWGDPTASGRGPSNNSYRPAPIGEPRAP